MRELLVRTGAGLLLALAVLGASGFSCEGPVPYGPVGFVEDDGRLGVVVATGRYAAPDHGEAYDLEAVRVRWRAADGSLTTPERVTALPDGWPSHEACIDAGCVDVDTHWLGFATTGSLPPAPLGDDVDRTRLVWRGRSTCGGHDVQAYAAAVDPLTGEVVVAMGDEGLAASDGGPWRRLAVGDARPHPLTLADGPAVLRNLAPDGVPVSLAAVAAAWVLVLLAHRGVPGGTARPLVMRLGIGLAAVVGLTVLTGGYAVIALMFLLDGAGGIGGLLVATVLLVPAISVGRGLPAGSRRALVRATGTGLLSGLALVAVWLVGAPLPWALVGPLAPVLAFGVTLALGARAAFEARPASRELSQVPAAPRGDV